MVRVDLRDKVTFEQRPKRNEVSHEDTRGKNLLGKGTEAKGNSSTMPLCWSTADVFRASKEAAGMTQWGQGGGWKRSSQGPDLSLYEDFGSYSDHIDDSLITSIWEGDLHDLTCILNCLLRMDYRMAKVEGGTL